jgi:hypothetical protein
LSGLRGRRQTRSAVPLPRGARASAAFVLLCCSFPCSLCVSWCSLGFYCRVVLRRCIDAVADLHCKFRRSCFTCVYRACWPTLSSSTSATIATRSSRCVCARVLSCMSTCPVLCPFQRPLTPLFSPRPAQSPFTPHNWSKQRKRHRGEFACLLNLLQRLAVAADVSHPRSAFFARCACLLACRAANRGLLATTVC